MLEILVADQRAIRRMRPSGEGRGPIHQSLLEVETRAGAVQPLWIAAKVAVQRLVKDLRAGVVAAWGDWCAGFDVPIANL